MMSCELGRLLRKIRLFYFSYISQLVLSAPSLEPLSDSLELVQVCFEPAVYLKNSVAVF